jgi:peptidoglycan/LPS O-acetylase OafA/YrhL
LIDVITAVLGWCLLLFAIGAFALFVVRRAKSHGLLAPVLVGFALRLVVMLIAHFSSRSLGDRGILVLDDETYFRGAQKLAAFWSAGQAPDPARVDILGTYQFGYQLFLGVLFTLGTSSILLGKLVNVLIGAANVLIVALLGGRVLGERWKLRAAWVTALAPSLVWWSAPLLKEALATMLVALGLLAITYLPRPRAVAGLAAVLAFLLILRGPAAFALVVGAGIAIAIAGRAVEGKWLSRPLLRFSAILVGGLVVVAVVVSRGNLHNLYDQYNLVVHRMIHQYQGGNPARVPYDAIKSLVTPLPWVFDRGTENWDRGLYPGVWLLFCALPLAAMGAWRLRRSPETWAMMGTAATALTINSITSGFVFRQRSMIEPVILLLALAGIRSWRMAARTASATLGVITVYAAVQSRSPLVAALIAAAAVAMSMLSRRLPARPLELEPKGHMVAGFRAWAAGTLDDSAETPSGPPLGTRAAQTLAAAARPFRAGAAAVRSLAPPLDRVEPAGGARPGAVWQRPRAAWTALLSGAPSAGVAPQPRWLRPSPTLDSPAPRRVPALDPGAVITGPATPQGPEESSASPARGYRPALDGVRAVAVLAVIAYHFTDWLPGGFLGVDIFFVLSGYLITTLLLSERVRRGRIDLGSFWARRARRLLPALLIMVVAVAVVIAQTAAPNTLGARRGDLIATVFYFANWHFIEVGQSYFAQFNGVSPLEHMWSLAIEEQFYLLWPLILMGAVLKWRGRVRPLLWLMGGGAVASAALMISSYSSTNPSRAYFGTDTRAYALLLGAFLATVVFVAPQVLTSEKVRRAVSLAWLPIVVLVGIALAGMKDQTGFYYQGGAFVFALVVVGLLLVVEVSPRSLPGRLLSLPPVRWIGMISYGLYLWHWPMILWLRDTSRIADPHVRQLVALLLTFAAATASFYIVERPIRAGRAPWLGRSTKRLAVAVAVGALGATAISVQATSLGSNPVALQVNDVGGHDCPSGSPQPTPGFFWCTRVQRASPGAPVIATIGDSTALSFDGGLRKVAARRGWGYIQAGKNGCSLLPLAFSDQLGNEAAVANARACIPRMPLLVADVAAKERPDVWLVSDRWSTLPMVTRAGRVLQPGNPRRQRIVEAAWRTRLRSLTADGARVVLVVTPPRGQPVDCATAASPPADCGSPTYSTADPDTAIARRPVLAAAARFPGKVAAVSIDDLVCPLQGRCPAVLRGQLIRYDGIHFTGAFGSVVLRAIFARAESAGIPLRSH